MLLGLVFGAGAGELVEYVTWTVGDYAVSYCATHTSAPEWHAICLENMGNYNQVKPYFHLVGAIAGLVVATRIAHSLIE